MKILKTFKTLSLARATHLKEPEKVPAKITDPNINDERRKPCNEDKGVADIWHLGHKSKF